MLFYHIIFQVREESGLALSSRNTLLKDRSGASVKLSRALFEIRDRVKSGATDCFDLCREAELMMQEAGLGVEYVEVVDVESLSPVDKIDDYAQLLAAVHVDGVRLIDNVRLEV